MTRTISCFVISIVVLLFLSNAPLEARSPWAGKDKPMHLISSAYLTYWNYHLNSNVLNNSHEHSLTVSISLTSLIGVGKECSDKYIKKTRFSWYDITYNVAGIALGVAIIEMTK